MLDAIGRGDFDAYSFPENWGSSASRAAALKTWTGDAPMPILTICGAETEDQRNPEWYVDAIKHFVDAWVESSSTGTRYLPQRAKPLLGVPLVGTGIGGGFSQLTSIVKQMIVTCQSLAAEHDIDIIITVRDARTFVCLQYLRRKEEYWPTIQGERLEHAKFLANKMETGKLVLFLGAGVRR